MWVKMKEDVHIQGYGWLLKGKVVPVIKKNLRYVYIGLGTGVVCRLARKRYCEEVKGWLFEGDDE